MNQRKVIVFIATSLDGFIAKPGDDLSFLSLVQQDGEDYGYADFIKMIDTVVIGRKTWDWVMKNMGESSHANLTTYVITHHERPAINQTFFYNGDLKALILKLKNEPGRAIFVDGGAEIIHALLMEKLIDEMYLSIVPVLLGSGTSLFKEGRPEQQFQLIGSRAYEKGLVQLHLAVTENERLT